MRQRCEEDVEASCLSSSCPSGPAHAVSLWWMLACRLTNGTAWSLTAPPHPAPLYAFGSPQHLPDSKYPTMDARTPCGHSKSHVVPPFKDGHIHVPQTRAVYSLDTVPMQRAFPEGETTVSVGIRGYLCIILLSETEEILGKRRELTLKWILS